MIAKTGLAQNQALIAEAIQRDPVIAGGKIAVLQENKGDINALISEALGKLSICVLVATPGARIKGLHANGGILCDSSPLTLQVFERPIFNRAEAWHYTALEIAEHLGVVLTDGTGEKNGVPMMFQSIENVDYEGGVSYLVTFHAGVQLRAIQPD